MPQVSTSDRKSVRRYFVSVQRENVTPQLCHTSDGDYSILAFDSVRWAMNMDLPAGPLESARVGRKVGFAESDVLVKARYCRGGPGWRNDYTDN